MWSQVQVDLERILADKIYPVLLTDAVYRHFLAVAGIQPSSTSISPRQQENFVTAAKIRARIIVAEIARSGGLEEHSCCAKLTSGAVLYRFWDSRVPERREGVWWFDQNVINTCKRLGGRSASDRREWLRQNLAVSIDWSKMDRIDTISLGPKSEIPAVEGIGKPMRTYSPEAIPQGKIASADYWANYGKYFPGGVKQTVLPFIPTAQGVDLNSFLSRA